MIIQFINIEYKIFFYSESDLYACYHILKSDNFLRYPDSYIILTDISDILLLLFYYYYYDYYVSISTFYFFFITQVFVNETTPRKYESSVLINDEN